MQKLAGLLLQVLLLGLLLRPLGGRVVGQRVKLTIDRLLLLRQLLSLRGFGRRFRVARRLRELLGEAAVDGNGGLNGCRCLRSIVPSSHSNPAASI